MKQFIIATFFLLSFSLVFGQGDVIKIKYKETSFMPSNINIPPQFAQNMPKSWDSGKILYASESKSLYVVNTEDAAPVEQNNMGRRFGPRGANEVVYADFDIEFKYTFTELFGKEFLVEDSLTTTPWKLHSGEQRDILGYNCVKATMQQDSTITTAWFSLALPYSFGPAGYSGLPGTILAVTVNEDRVILATSVDENPTTVPPFEKPKKGEKISRANFIKLSEEKRKEMQSMYGGGRGGQGGMIMIRN